MPLGSARRGRDFARSNARDCLRRTPGQVLNPSNDRIQAVIHHPAASASEKETMTGAMEVVLRLRHWPGIREKFAAACGTDLEAAYRELDLKPPAWASIDRKELVAHLKDLEKAYQEHPEAGAAKDKIEHLVHVGLARLDPTVIPPDWI